MPQADAKKERKTPTTLESTYGESEQTLGNPRVVKLALQLKGEVPGPGEWTFLALLNGQTLLSGKWHNDLILQSESLPLDLNYFYHQTLIADKPLIFILRLLGKGNREGDPLLNPDNRAGATVDLFPLVLGQEEIFTEVSLLLVSTGERTGCAVEVRATSDGAIEPFNKVPLHLTMISAHCLPYAKDGTVYLAAIGLNDLIDEISVNFGMSLSTPSASKVVWATASNAGYAANTAFSVPYEDMFIPYDFEPSNKENCTCVYWNAMKRVLVDPELLRDRVTFPFFFELAGVPRYGKIDVRGRYMAFFDAKVLLEPGQFGVTACSKLSFYNEVELSPDAGPLLDLPPTSAKVSARETDQVTDEFGHCPYIILRIDLTKPLVPKPKNSWLYELIGFLTPDRPSVPVYELEAPLVPDDTKVDVRRIRKESGALAVHKELSGLACRGVVPMNQGIKRTAANSLLMRVRTMLKQFPPGNCLEIDWQDIATSQHAASRRAVTASFAPQPPPPRLSSRVAAARCRLAGDNRIAEEHIKANLKADGNHPRSLLSKAIRCLEERNDMDARDYILDALSIQTRNRFLLWAFGAQEFEKGNDGVDAAAAAFQISVTGNYSEGTANAIGWAALHTLHHCNENSHAAFVSAQKMRKSYELPKGWKLLLQQWIETSGEEEVFWNPAIINDENPIILAATFFLCLRCFAMSERLLKCFEQGCGTRGSRHGHSTKITNDLYYIRAASLIIKRDLDEALEMTIKGIRKFGPSAMLSQMRTTCLICLKGWDGECESALQETEKAGAKPSPAILLKAAMGGIETDPQTSLQRAARAHKAAPNAHSALIIGRIYYKLGEEALAERWAAAAVKLEPLLADGWAFLSLLAMHERNLDKARTMLRTARQVGPISPDIEDEVKKTKEPVQMDTLTDTVARNLCLCDYY